MLIRWLEHLLISGFNRTRRPPVAAPPAVAALPADHAVLGQIMANPDTESATSSAPPSPQVVSLSPGERRRHLYLLGATGSGKTNLLLRLIESDIAHQRAFCVIDLRGDLVDRILPRLAAAAPPEAWKRRLLLIDLRDPGHSVGFNPLQGEGDLYSRSLHLLDVLKAQSESWGVQLEETLRNCLLALAQTGGSILEIEPLLQNRAFRAQVVSRLEDARVCAFFERYEQLSAPQQLTWSLSVLNKIAPLLSIPALRRLLGQSQSFQFGALLDTQPGMVILISLAIDRFGEASRLLGGLFVSTFQTAIMARIEQPEAQRVPVFLYVDEFETMATERFENIIAEGRRFGLGLCLSHQNISQLPPRLKQVVRNNVYGQVFFQTGALDATELAGEITGAESREVAKARLMSQGVGQAYVIRRGQSSVQIQTALCPDPKVRPAQIEALRLVSLHQYARPVAEVDAELEAREKRWSTPTQTSPSAASSAAAKASSGAAPTSNATYEIRHEKRHSFKPRLRQEPEDVQSSEQKSATEGTVSDE